MKKTIPLVLALSTTAMNAQDKEKDHTCES